MGEQTKVRSVTELAVKVAQDPKLQQEITVEPRPVLDHFLHNQCESLSLID